MTMRAFIRISLCSLIALVAMAICFPQRQFGGPIPPDCLAVIREIYRNTSALNDERIYHLRYTVRTVEVRNGREVTHSSSVDFTANNRRLQAISDELEVYQDYNVAVTVVPANRTIYIGRSDPARFRESRGSITSRMHDSLLKHCDLLACEELRQKDADRRVTLRPHSGARRTLGIATLSFTLDTKRKEVRRMSINYDPGRQARRIEIDFGTPDYDYRTADFAQSVGALFFNDRGGLLPKYSGYQVVDLRKNSGK